MASSQNLLADVGKLGVQLLDARMRRQKRRRELCELALHLDALLDQPADQLGLENFGRRVDVAAIVEHLLDEPRARLGFRALRLSENELAVDLRELLRIEGDIVAAGIKALTRAELLGGGLPTRPTFLRNTSIWSLSQAVASLVCSSFSLRCHST